MFTVLVFSDNLITITMKVTSKLLECVHPDKTTCLLSGKNVKIILELFNLLDIHDQGELNGKLMNSSGRMRMR